MKEVDSFVRSRLVDEVSTEAMDGDDLLEKQVNAYLTKQFIVGRNVPADECLDEARTIIRMVKESLGL